MLESWKTERHTQDPHPGSTPRFHTLTPHPGLVLQHFRPQCFLHGKKVHPRQVSAGNKRRPTQRGRLHSQHWSDTGAGVALLYIIDYGSTSPQKLRPVLIWKHGQDPTVALCGWVPGQTSRSSRKYSQGFHLRPLMMTLTDKGKRAGNYQGI